MEEATQPTITRIVVLSCYLVTCTRKAIQSLHSERRQSKSTHIHAHNRNIKRPQKSLMDSIIFYFYSDSIYSAIFRTSSFSQTEQLRPVLRCHNVVCLLCAEYVCAREDIKNPKSHFVYCLPAQSSVRFTGSNFKPRLYMFLCFAFVFIRCNLGFICTGWQQQSAAPQYSVGDIRAPNLIFYLWFELGVCVCCV